ncbi:SusC/RagA family TonB-linked outer membrane protein, partial [Chitinophaga sp.]|uniref:SusC/RagA family TonB-linked outer membrane protein n=1 Tax=Chitinophaga sp. TaxID=1869181 RepID=UPI002C74C211
MQKTANFFGCRIAVSSDLPVRWPAFNATQLMMRWAHSIHHHRSIYKQLMIAMKLTVLLLTAAFLQVQATGLAQSVTLSARNMPLQKIFTAIQQQTGYVAFYNKEMLARTTPVSLNVQDMALNDALEVILKDQPVDYFIKDKTIILSEKKSPDNTLSGITYAGMNALPAVQAQPISGIILNAEGQALVGASVKIKGTAVGTVTDDAGKFSLPAEPGQTLLISYVGYTSQEIKAGTHRQLTITLQHSNNALDEAVVVGYGTTKRKDLTGAVSSVNMAEVKDVPFATIDQALTGKAAGVQVVQADGSPGGVAKIRIRGGTSLLGGNDPLYIIDGVQMQIQNRYLQSAAEIVSPVESFGSMGGGDDPANTISGSFSRGLNSLGGLNINDIESIDILKDASATAIYGSRAANGVVIITTKKGKRNQKPFVEANYYTGFSKPIKEKLLNRDQYIMIMKEAAKNLNDIRASLTPALPPDPVATGILTDPDYMGTGNTDWLKLVLRNGITHNADLSVRGGGTGSRYYASLSYNKNEGVVRGTDYTRLAGKINLDNEINSRLRITTNLDYGFSTNNITNGAYTQALFAPPTMKPYNEDGSVHVFDPLENGSGGFEGFQSPLSLLKGINKSNTFSLIGSQSAEYDILKDLKFRSAVSVNFNNYQQTNYVPSTVQVSDKAGGGWPGSSNNGMATQAQSQTTDAFFENTLTWDKQFNENNRINILGGTSWQISKSSAFSASGQGFPDDVYLNNISSAALTLPATGVSGQNSLLSFYMRANYAWFEKYLFTFTGRSD